MMKILRIKGLFIAAMLALFSLSTNAALVDMGTYLTDTNTKMDPYLTKCLSGDFKKIQQKHKSEKIPQQNKGDLSISGMGKIPLHIQQFEEFCFTHNSTCA